MNDSFRRKRTQFFLAHHLIKRATKFTVFFLVAVLSFPQMGYSQVDTTSLKHQISEVQNLIKHRKYETALQLIDSVLQPLPKAVRETNEDALYLSFRKSSAYFSLGDFKQAIKVGEECLCNRERVFPAIHKDIAKSHNNLGNYYRKTRTFDKAMEHHKKALHIRQNLYDNKHTQIAKSYNNIGHVFLDMMKYDSAHLYHDLATEMYKTLLGAKDIKIFEQLAGTALIYQKQGQYEKAIIAYKQAIKDITDSLGPYDIHLEWPYNNLGALLDGIGRNKEAIIYEKLSLELRKKSYGVNHFILGYSHNNLGLTYRKIGDISHAKKHLEKAISIFQEKLPKNHPLLAEPYNNLSGVYLFNGNYDKAIEYLKKAIYLWKNQDNNQLDLAMGYYNLSTVYESTNKLDLALQYNNSALQIRKKLLDQNSYLIGESYFNSGLIASKMDSLHKALNLYDQAFQIFNQLPSYNYLAQIYTNSANVYLSLNQLDSAFSFYNKSLEIFQNKQYINNRKLSKTYLGLAKYYIKKKDFSKAEDILRQAFFVTGIKLGYSSNPHHLETSEALEKAKLLQRIKQLQYNQSKNINHLYQEKLYMDALVNSIYDGLDHIPFNNKIQFSSSLEQVLQNMIKNEFILFTQTDSIQYLNNCYKLMERTKAFLLFESLKRTKALRFSNIPDSILSNEINIRIDIAYYDRLIQDQMNNEPNATDSVLIAINSKLFDAHRKHEQIINYLESHYPKYYAATHNIPTISLDDVQTKLLQPNQTMLEYVVGNSSIFIFLVQKDFYDVKEVKIDFPLQEWVQMMTKDGIFGFHPAPKTLQTKALKFETISNYSQAAQNLYTKLIKPFEAQLTQKLIIIPDGVLGYIPFEALLTQPYPKLGAFHAYPYLINKYQVSYSYSATLLKEMKEKKHLSSPQGQILGIAPFSNFQNTIFTPKVDSTNFYIKPNRSDSLNILPASEIEVNQILNSFSGIKLMGENATIAHFYDKASRYKIIHLSTHAEADDRVGDYAYLAFSNPTKTDSYDKLYAKDIYNLDLNADMVVLSACETGTGKLQKGEGIISLARAFAYAGAKSIFTTLWKVNDTRTKDVIVSFYRYLKDGLPKDEALRKAKLDYLKKGHDTHPYFWSGLIGIGDMSPIH